MQTQITKRNNWTYKVTLRPENTSSDNIISRNIQFGLYVLGTEKHESRRIDNQLRGRSGRQWDSGVTQFFVALDDDIMRKMWWDKIQSFARMAIPASELEDLELTQSQFTSSIIRAQKQMEAHNFSIRKHLFDYDSVINKQRIKIYKLRDEILEDRIDIYTQIKNMITQVCDTQILSKQTQWFSNDEIIESINQIFGTNLPILDGSSRDTIYEYIHNFLQDKFEKLLIQIDEDKRNFIMKYIYLDNIDKYWIDHIDNMQHLREKVWLYGYAQQDPVVIYKQEWFDMFNTMNQNIDNDTIANIFRIDTDRVNSVNLQSNISIDATTNSDQFETDWHDIYDNSASPIIIDTNNRDSLTSKHDNWIEIISADSYSKVSSKNWSYRPNDKVSVMYQDGRIETDIKFKKIEEDYKNWLCKMI